MRENGWLKREKRMVIPERVAQLNGLAIDRGEHVAFDHGHCAMELVSWLAGEPFSMEPACACPTITRLVTNFNKAEPTAEDLTQLRSLLPEIAESRSSDAEALSRSWMAMDWLARTCAPAWLKLTTVLESHAKALRDGPEITDRDTLASHRDNIAAAYVTACQASRMACDEARVCAAGRTNPEVLRRDRFSLDVFREEFMPEARPTAWRAAEADAYLRAHAAAYSTAIVVMRPAVWAAQAAVEYSEPLLPSVEGSTWATLVAKMVAHAAGYSSVLKPPEPDLYFSQLQLLRRMLNLSWIRS